MDRKTKGSYLTTIYEFIKGDILVVCPYCKNRALIKARDFPFAKFSEEAVSFVCTNCGRSKYLAEKPGISLNGPKRDFIVGRRYIIGGGIVPFFHLPLWLTKSFGENLLWAYNLRHLHALREHVEDRLRERNGQVIVNRSLGSRLPKWMTSKKNREQILKAIDELKENL